jgi:hypothetical protein
VASKAIFPVSTGRRGRYCHYPKIERWSDQACVARSGWRGRCILVHAGRLVSDIPERHRGWVLPDIDASCGQQRGDARRACLWFWEGEWSRFLVPTFPFDTVWPIVCVATWENLSRGRIRGLRLCLSNPDGIEPSAQPLELPAIAVPSSRGPRAQVSDEADSRDVTVRSTST